MKNPSAEWLKVCELMDELWKHNLNMTINSELFIEGLYNNLDPFEPFLEQQSLKQKKWLDELHAKYIEDVW